MLKKFWAKHSMLMIAILSTLASAALYATSIRFFVQNENAKLVTGGISGISLIISRFVSSDPDTQLTLYSILYIVLNIPVFLLGYFAVGKRFSVFSFINVIVASVLIRNYPGFIEDFFLSSFTDMDPLAIALFAGLFSGLGSGIALLGNTSGGGTDVIAVYFGLRKGISIGRYVMALNGAILLTGALISGRWMDMLYSVVYLYITSSVIDQMHVRNKKELLQIVTAKGDEVSKALISCSLHGVTIVPAKGAFTGRDKSILYMVVSAFELKKFLHVIQTTDPESFTMTSSIDAVYGKFYMPPIG